MIDHGAEAATGKDLDGATIGIRWFRTRCGARRASKCRIAVEEEADRAPDVDPTRDRGINWREATFEESMIQDYFQNWGKKISLGLNALAKAAKQRANDSY